MFTGLVERMGRVSARRPLSSGVRLSIEHGYDGAVARLELGESVSVSGACLTVAALGDGPLRGGSPGGSSLGGGWFEIDASVETLEKTTLGDWQVGTFVNLERALTLGARLGGHLVSGHVDGVGRIDALDPVGDMMRIGIAVPADLARYVARKGSLCVDGVSLTVNDVTDLGPETRAELLIIPHTRSQTTLGQLVLGQRVNLEIDLIARYIERLLPGQPAARS